MKRFTKHIFEDDYYRDMYYKLKYLEDIEEELGIELRIMFKALKDGVWYFDEQGQLVHDYVRLENNYKKLSFSFQTCCSGQTLFFEDYCKKWSVYELDLPNGELKNGND